MKKTISLAEAKKRLSEIVIRAAYGGETFLITRRGRPAAILRGAAPNARGPELADLRGWLGETDPFFSSLAEARTASRRSGPRVIR